MSSNIASHDANRVPSTMLAPTVGTNPLAQTGVSLSNSTPAHVAIVDGSGNQITSFAATGMLTFSYDYVAYTATNSTTDTYVFKTGGSGGTTVGTITIVYTDTTKSQISTVTKT